MIFAISLETNLKADIPLELKPSDEPHEECFMCLSKEQAKNAQACFERDKLYKNELGPDSSFWQYILIGATAGLAAGIIITPRH